MCLPVTASLPEVMHAADTEAIIGLLSKMAVDRSITSNIADAREAFINATVDILNAFKIAQNLPSGQSGQLIAPRSLALLPLYISALLKHVGYRLFFRICIFEKKCSFLLTDNRSVSYTSLNLLPF